MKPFGQPIAGLKPAVSWTAPFSCDAPADPVDPVTFEIIRHRLWFAGMTIGETLKKVSGTIVVSEAQDMSTYITLPDSAPVFLGPYVLLHAGIASLIVENSERANRDAGIRPGDMFFLNDPWMGMAHQADCAIVAPFFVGKEIFAWTGVTLHQLDMGGIDPGGVCPNAKDAYGEPRIYPAVRIAERGKMRPDIDRMLRRNSRLPDILALDVRSMFAANRAAHRDIAEIVDRYGARTVRAVMQKMLRDAYDGFGARLQELPRGTFRARDFFEIGGYAPEQQQQIFEIDLAVTNTGEKLIFDFSGTSAQAESFVNCGFGGMVGGILGALLQQIAYDIPWNGGVIKRLELRSQPGTVNNPTWPAAVSGGITEGAISTGTAASMAIAQMIVGAPKIRERMTMGAGSIFLGSTLGGLNPDGSFWGTLLMDPIGMGGSASDRADGVDLCGSGAIPYTQYANVESAEQHYPLLYLFRRVAPDAYGLGRHRGGQALEFGFKLHNVPFGMMMLWCHGAELPNVSGICGAGPSAAARFLLARGAGIDRRWSERYLPTALSEFSFEALPAKMQTLIGPDDVVVFGVPGGGGYGDPLGREPAAVADDVRAGRLSAAVASDFYGVVLRDGEPDEGATAARRAQIIAERRSGSRMPSASATRAPGGRVLVDAGAGMVLLAGGSDGVTGPVWACSVCRHVYAPAQANPREFAAVREAPIRQFGHPLGQQVGTTNPRFLLREFFCPTCFIRFACEVVRPNQDAPIHAIDYDPDWLKELAGA